MATIYSRSAMLIQGLLDGTGGAGLQGLAATVTQVIVGTNMSNAAGTLTDIAFTNPHATNNAFLQFFDVAAVASVTLGTTVATAVYTLPANTTGVLQVNQTFANGIAVAATTTATGSTPATTPVVVGIAYL